MCAESSTELPSTMEVLAIIRPETPMCWYRAAFVLIRVGNRGDISRSRGRAVGSSNTGEISIALSWGIGGM